MKYYRSFRRIGAARGPLWVGGLLLASAATAFASHGPCGAGVPPALPRFMAPEQVQTEQVASPQSMLPPDPLVPALRLSAPERQASEGFRMFLTSADATVLTSALADRIALLTTTNPVLRLSQWRELAAAPILAEGRFRFDAVPCDDASRGTYFAVRVSPPSTAVTVSNAAGLRAAVAAATPGSRILLAPGTYPGGFYFTNLRGAAGRPIVIAAADPQDPPVIQGGGNGIQLSDPEYVELHNLVFTGATGNGVNVDDGGSFATPARHLVLRGLQVRDVGPEGNRDGLKLSGVVDFRVEGCQVERWGTGGSGIDLVGCHRGVIESNLFRHTSAGASGGANGVQAKGGTRAVVIRRNRFEHPGARGVNIGGSTGLEFFRPPLVDGEAHAEARDIVVEGNVFIGGVAPVAFVGVEGAVVRFNTIYRPERWAFRILQETTAPGFVPCRHGRFTDNLVAFHSSQWVSGGGNLGPHTAPATFQFARNWWYCVDDPSRSRPTLPVPETAGVYGQSPRFLDAESGDLGLHPDSPARGVGATALPE